MENMGKNKENCGKKCGYYNMKEITMANNILFILRFNNTSDGVSKNVEASP